MLQIEHPLVVRVGMNRGHEAAIEPEVVHDDFDDRDEAVGGARRIRDHVMIFGVIIPLVDSHHDRDVFLLGGRADDDFLGAGLEMERGLVPLRKDSGRLQHDIHAKVSPREFGGIALCQHLDRRSVHYHLVAFERDRTAVAPMYGVVPQQVGERAGIGEIVDRHHHHLGVCGGDRSHYVPANTPEPVDSDSN